MERHPFAVREERTAYSGMEQMVARYAHNVEVEGSSPSPATNFFINMDNTIENKVASAILQKNIAELEIDGKVYKIAPPSIATLILISEIISHFPIVEQNVPKEKVLYYVLHYAKQYSALGELVAILILGAKGLLEERVETTEKRYLFGLIRRKEERKVIVDKKAELAKIILENIRPSVLFDVVVKRLNQLEITSFFAITTSLSEANILKPTKEVAH